MLGKIFLDYDYFGSLHLSKNITHFLYIHTQKSLGDIENIFKNLEKSSCYDSTELVRLDH